MSTEPWVTAEHVAQHLGVAKDTVYRWRERKGLPAHRIGRLWKGYCAQFTDKFHENYFSYIIHIDSGLESNVSAYHRRSVPSSHAFASTLQLHKSASRCISDSS